MSVLHFKADVYVTTWRERAAVVLREACVWSLESGVNVHVSSWQDDAAGRVADSLHEYGLAVDLNVDGGAAADRARLANHLWRTLPPGYDLVLERDHLHVEWDAHRPALT